jgi:hypothetical protein
MEFDGKVEWLIDLTRTIDNLLDQRRRCLEIINDRMREACMLSFRAQAVLEATRVTNDLRTLANDEVAAQFYNDMLACFGITSDPVKNLENGFEVKGKKY